MRTAIIHVHVVPGDGGPEIPDATLLIEDGELVEIGGDVQADDAEVLDATGLTAVPGMVDGHQHMWQTALRGSGADMSIGEYARTVLPLLPSFSPDDLHAATLLGAAESLNAGITTVFDWRHAALAPEHSDAADDALLATGIRALVGAPAIRGSKHREALAIMGPEIDDYDVAVRQIRLGRESGVQISFHAQGSSVARLHDDGLLGPDLNIAHLNAMTEQDARWLAAAGVGVTMAPTCEAGIRAVATPYGRFLAAGGRAGLATDTVINGVPGLFEPLRALLWSERVRTGEVVPAASLLSAATVDSARAIGLADRIGTLSVGKRADVLLIDGLAHLTGDRASAVVTSTGVDNVRTVLVDGRVVKRDGRLVDHDLAALRATTQRMGRPPVTATRAPEM
ncbi:amidohydrolase family protein [Cryptosporangium sp. NPDC048952]|uniref:amidohydrolase family protein n=1 Tax=Cryptosporangium sp. NPDC048952 TaxID=3363961 RepID=UPI003710D073